MGLNTENRGQSAVTKRCERPCVRPLRLEGRGKALTTATNLWLAPLAGWTDHAFRRAIRALGGVGLALTEVISACALTNGSTKSLALATFSPDDAPLAAQISAESPELAASAARLLEAKGLSAIDLNLGCPVRKLNRKGKGAALMRNPTLAAEIAAAIVEAVRIPVTAKLRLGWNAAERNAPALARALERAGISALTVHGRTRAQAFSGAVDLEAIAEVVEAVSIPVIANGDLRTLADIRRAFERTAAAGVMIGRGAIEDPFLFCTAARALGAETDANAETMPPERTERLRFVRRHFEGLMELHGERHAARVFRKIARVYALALGGADALAGEAVQIESRADLDRLLEQLRIGPATSPTERGRLVPVPSRPVDRW